MTLSSRSNITEIFINHDIKQLLVNSLTKRPEAGTLVFFTSDDDGSECTHLRKKLLHKFIRLFRVFFAKSIDQFLERIFFSKLARCKKASVLSDAVVKLTLFERLALIIKKRYNSNTVFLILFRPPKSISLFILSRKLR